VDKTIHILKQSGILLLEVLLMMLIGAFLLTLYFGILYPFLSEQMIPAETDDLFIDYPYEMLVINFLPICAIAIAVIWFVHRVIFRRDDKELGFNSKGLLSQFGIGTLLGAVLVLVGFFLLLLTDQVDVTGTNPNLYLLIGFLVMFIFQSFGEEILFRSYLIPTIENRLGTWAALIISSILFALLHIGNVGIGWIGSVNLIVGGGLMGLLFLRYRNIWAPTGFHFAWNYVQSSVLGFEVSGVKTYSYWQMKDKGIDLWTGGDFGYEGSLIAVIFIMAASYVFWKDSPELRAEFKPIEYPKPDESPIA